MEKTHKVFANLAQWKLENPSLSFLEVTTDPNVHTRTLIFISFQIVFNHSTFFRCCMKEILSTTSNANFTQGAGQHKHSRSIPDLQ